LAKNGYKVYLGARRIERVKRIADEIGGEAAHLDVADQMFVEQFCSQLPDRLDLLVNNAGGALGLSPVEEADDDDWLHMYESNVLGLMRMTRELLPRLKASDGHIINVTSIAGRGVYPGGAGYTAVKYGARAVTETLRLELNGTKVRVTDVAPGLVETEFSLVRFKGDTEKAKNVYEGVTALTAEDIAECILWAATRPWHVNIDEIVVKPVAQASATMVARNVGL
jgi:NADP-dependent 3-hydroxy acid dehydrogenase YdfG